MAWRKVTHLVRTSENLLSGPQMTSDMMMGITVRTDDADEERVCVRGGDILMDRARHSVLVALSMLLLLWYVRLRCALGANGNS